ncbi:MAG TPA: glycosyltransferase family 2 protein, partial [Candidatus Acidoferrum sp.]|nr:glycosyltransferase family 2 protein [Candidatus Acidoferrum sp.]
MQDPSSIKGSRVSVLIPTFNEELNLPDCLGSIDGWAQDVWVVDSYSTDRTMQIARESGADVVQHVFEGYAQQKNWALENVPFRGEWVLILDADERVPPELAAEISGVVAADGNGYDGFYLNRKLIFYGKWIRHCGWYPSWNLRLFRRGRGRYEQREVHEHLLLDGKAGYCQNDLIHEDLRDMSFWIAKHNRYSSQEARELDRVRRGVSTAGLQASFFKGSLERKRFIKERIWPHLPGRTFLSFLYWYFFRLGFLDGKH